MNLKTVGSMQSNQVIKLIIWEELYSKTYYLPGVKWLSGPQRPDGLVWLGRREKEEVVGGKGVEESMQRKGTEMGGRFKEVIKTEWRRTEREQGSKGVWKKMWRKCKRKKRRRKVGRQEGEQGDSRVWAVSFLSFCYCVETNFLERVERYTVLHKAADCCIVSLLRQFRLFTTIDTVDSLLPWIPQVLA